MKKISLARENIDTLNNILNEFPEIAEFSLTEESCEIGSIHSIVFDKTINGHKAQIKIDIDDYNYW